MFQRFHEMREKDEGFTLIELLVVILIVAILAAVAIPVFLRQREKGYVDQVESALKNSATAIESYATSNNGDYSLLDGETCTDACAAASLIGLEGFSGTQDVTVTVNATATTYCIDGSHTSIDGGAVFMKYDSAVGAPEGGPDPDDLTC